MVIMYINLVHGIYMRIYLQAASSIKCIYNKQKSAPEILVSVIYWYHCNRQISQNMYKILRIYQLSEARKKLYLHLQKSGIVYDNVQESTNF